MERAMEQSKGQVFLVKKKQKWCPVPSMSCGSISSRSTEDAVEKLSSFPFSTIELLLYDCWTSVKKKKKMARKEAFALRFWAADTKTWHLLLTFLLWNSLTVAALEITLHHIVYIWPTIHKSKKKKYSKQTNNKTGPVIAVASLLWATSEGEAATNRGMTQHTKHLSWRFTWTIWTVI